MKIRTTGATVSWIPGTSTHLTASEVPGTGAAIGTRGTTTEHGHIRHGDTIHGTTIHGIMTHGITEDGTIHGTTADMQDSGASAHGTDGIRIMPDGTEDGMTLIGDIISDRDIYRDTIMEARAIIPTRATSLAYTTAQDTAQDPTGSSQEQVLFAEAVQ